MCMGCFTGVEAAAVNAAVGAVAARSGLARLRARRAGRGSSDRRRAAYRANAEFLAGIGLEPERVLGPPPGTVHRDSDGPDPARAGGPPGAGAGHG